MSNINTLKIKEYAIKFRKYLWIGYTIIGFIILKKQYENLVSKILEIGAFSVLDTKSIWIDFSVLIVIGILFFSYYLPKLIGHIYIPSNRNTFVLAIIIGISIYYRFFSEQHPWLFIGTFICSSIKYVDFVYVIFLFQITLYTRSSLFKCKKINSSTDIEDCDKLFDDDPILKVDSSSAYVKRIITLLKNSQFKTSFAIGIIGFWGKGKTTFAKKLQNELDKENYISYHFTPWDYTQTPKHITTEFFTGLSSCLSQYHSSLSDLLKMYVENISQISDPDLSLNSVLKKSISMFSSLSSDSIKKQLQNAIDEMGTRIIVYIDDIDRLDKEEIIEIAKLIRSTANFKNLVFILCYDKEYVENAAKDINNHNYKFFFEKIVQLEIDLPMTDNLKIGNYLSNFLEKNYEEEFKSLGVEKGFKRKIEFTKYFYSYRDVNRFINSFNLNYNLLKGEVDFIDFILIEILRIKYNDIYSKLALDKDEIIKLEPLNSRSLDYTFQLTSKVNDICKDSPDLKEILSGLFPTENTWIDSIKSSASIQLPTNYNNYFNFQLHSGRLSRVEFKKLRKGGIKENFFKQINIWIIDGNFHELKRMLYEITDYQSKSDFELIVECIFYLEHNWNLDKNLTYTSVWFHSDKDELEYLVKGRNGKVTSQLYTPNEYKRFLYSLFAIKTEYYPFDVERSLIYDLLDKEESEDKFRLTTIELEEIMKNYLQTVLKNERKFNNTVWAYYKDCEKREILEGLSIKVKLPFVKDLFIDFTLKEDFRGFFIGFISRDGRIENHYRLDSNLYFVFFNKNIQELYKFVAEHRGKDPEFVDQFLSFTQQQQMVGPDNYHNFNFSFKVFE